MLYLYNSLTKKKELFKPRFNKKAELFVCGPTVYDYSHIGHAKTYINFDVIVKYLKYQGYKVFYLQNITDIDDKIINRANENNQNPLELSKQFADAYFEDIKKLKITSVNKYAFASDFIPVIIKQIKTLIQKGFAYESNGSVYFEVSKFKDYGKLSGQSFAKLKKAVQIEPDPNKRRDFDFALWKKAKPDEPNWESSWGKGRPGWHIEDTAISERYFGPQYDIHGGANELKFPHHEAEIAQQESASGKKPFVKYWLHTGVLEVAGEKMSKSLGNFLTIREFLKFYSPEDFRLLTLQHHYRKPLKYSENSIKQAAEAIRKIKQTIERLKIAAASQKKIAEKQTLKLNELEQKFQKAMNDDFNTSRALAIFFNFIKKINIILDRNSLSKSDGRTAFSFIKIFDKIFGIIPLSSETKIPGIIRELAEQRETLRKQEKWETADKIREEIQKKGWDIRDKEKGYELESLIKN